MTAHIIHADSLRIMRHWLPESSIDVIVTDPPYGLAFMGKEWDHGVPGVPFWAAAYRVLKPGGHLLAFGGTRTHHRLMVAIEDAGFEIRDCLMWLYGSGFPKSLDVSKAIDKAAGAERETVGRKTTLPGLHRSRSTANHFTDDTWQGSDDAAQAITVPATDLARQWDGWGTALKPAWEPIIMARKPLAGTVAANVQAYGTGGINIDGCRIGTNGERPTGSGSSSKDAVYALGRSGNGGNVTPDTGRWPANLILDEAAAELLDEQSGERKAGSPKSGSEPKAAAFSGNIYGDAAENGQAFSGYGDTGGASRFFYTAKASRAERNAGLHGMPGRMPHPDEPNGRAWDIPGSHSAPRANHHPTVKPLDLMRWLVRMVTPPGGMVLDPFNGSGSTGCAAVLEGLDYLGIELEAEYVELAERRIAHWAARVQPRLLPDAPVSVTLPAIERVRMPGF